MPHKILAAGFIATLIFVGASRADDYDKKTTLTVHEPLIVPGQQLQPGKYVIKLMNSSSDRHIVQIFNEDQSHLITTIFAIAASRTQPTDDTALMYWETPAGPALRSWFWPGDLDGQEFAYPKETAARIVAANAGAKVPVVDESGNLTTTGSTTEVAENRNATEPANTFAERTAPAAAPPPVVAPPPVITPQPEAAAPPVDNTLLAQNQPPPANPVRPNPAPANDNANARELPKTASPLSWAIGIGFLSLAGAFLLRRLAANS